MSYKKKLISQEQLPEVLRLLDLGIPAQRVASKFGTSQALILQVKVLRGIPDYDVNNQGPSKLCKTYSWTKQYLKNRDDQKQGKIKIEIRAGKNHWRHA